MTPPSENQNPAPLTLEYQSRIIKAKNLAVGGLTLLGGAIATLAMMVAIGMIAASLDPSIGKRAIPVAVALSMMLLATGGILMIVCARRILRNHMASARLARWLVSLLFIPMAALFGFLWIEHFDDIHDEGWATLLIIAACSLAVFGGLIAVLVELSIVTKAILQGDFSPPEPPAATHTAQPLEKP